jgi:PAS domain-containing protein
MTDRRAADSVGEALFARIVAEAPDAIAVQDMTARIEWVNPACERLYGWSLAEVRGRKPLDFILPPEARPDPAPIARFRYDPDSGLSAATGLAATCAATAPPSGPGRALSSSTPALDRKSAASSSPASM